MLARLIQIVNNFSCYRTDAIIISNNPTINTYSCIDGVDASNCTWKNTIPFVAPIDSGLVIKVYDGDTITIAAKLPYKDSEIYRFSVRLNGIDCPEMKGKDENEKGCAILAKNEIAHLVLNNFVTLKNVCTEKYGRVLADVYIGDLHLNQHLLDKRLAVAYSGKTKISPTNWMDYHNNGTI